MLEPLHLQSYNDCYSGYVTRDMSITRVMGEVNTNKKVRYLTNSSPSRCQYIIEQSTRAVMLRDSCLNL